MPRLPRLDAPGLLHHIIGRGIERRPIFITKEDYSDFLKRIETSIVKSPNQILAWCLMPNHFHMLVRSGQGGLKSFMQRLLAGYAGAFNARHHRVGHLFQNRYKSIVCEEDTYLLELVRYVHLNPLRAGLLKTLNDLRDYPHTGHRALMGTASTPWQETEEVLSHFDNEVRTARLKYERFLADGLSQKDQPDLMGGGLIRSQGGLKNLLASRSKERDAFDSRILGSGSFVEDVIKTSELKDQLLQELKRRQIKVSQVAKQIAEEYKVDQDWLFQKNRTDVISKAKALLIYVGAEYLGKSNREMAEMAKISEPAACKARWRGKEFFEASAIKKWLKLIS